MTAVGCGTVELNPSQHSIKQREKCGLALSQVAEQRALEWQHLVQAAIQRVLRYQRIILAEKIPHRALLEPLPMQPPFAAGINQPVAHQRLQDMPPAGSLARVRQALCREPIELQLFVEMTRKPAGSPLPRAA
jgi:hypothetical protein